MGIQLEQIISKAEEMELLYETELQSVHPAYRKSARNLVHYLALRSFNLTGLQQDLRYHDLPDLTGIEGHVMRSLNANLNIIRKLLDSTTPSVPKKGISIKQSEKALRRNTGALFGNKPNKRSTRIMVTLPSESAESYPLVSKLLKRGMNSARINCAHDDETRWAAMIENIRRGEKSHNRSCKIMMDLGGPKLRTGAMEPGPQVQRFKPQRDTLGNVIQPAKIWIAPPDIQPPDHEVDAIIPVRHEFADKMKKGNFITFTDSRGKECRIDIVRKQGQGRWGECSDSVYLTTGTELILHKVREKNKEKSLVGELLPFEQFITLDTGDRLLLHSSPIPGNPAAYGQNGELLKPAHISCTLPEIFQFVQPGQPVFMDDGRIEGMVQRVNSGEMEILITHASEKGSKLKSDKGINFPETDIVLSGLTSKDLKDLEFVGRHADAVNLSFVNTPQDVKDLQAKLAGLGSEAGIVLKIETRKGFSNLPGLLLQAMQTHPIGIMVARGDLAIEAGWENFAYIQEEILRIGQAAHIPVIWATQVLETLSKKGVPTRSEITDAALSQRAECVMLNKGPYIGKTLKTLNKILIKTQKHQKKQSAMLPRLMDNNELKLIYNEQEVLADES